MNAAEITDKLGLHSLRQRAWVSLRAPYDSTTCLLTQCIVHPIDLCYFWRWSLRRTGMVEQLTPKGWAQLGRASRVLPSTQHAHPSCRPPLMGVLWSPNIVN